MQKTTKQNSRIQFSEAQKERWRRALAARKKEIENGSARQKNAFLGVFLLACPELAEQFPWEDLSGSGWSFLLSGRPEFAGRCPWDELTGEDWGESPVLPAHVCRQVRLGETGRLRLGPSPAGAASVRGKVSVGKAGRRRLALASGGAAPVRGKVSLGDAFRQKLERASPGPARVRGEVRLEEAFRKRLVSPSEKKARISGPAAGNLKENGIPARTSVWKDVRNTARQHKTKGA